MSSPPTKKSKGDAASVDHCVNTIRVLAADMVEKANSGHPGAPMGCAPLAHVLYGEVMHYSPTNPKWANRDRFVLSNGHACALLYSMLHLTGYDLSLDDLKNFRQLHSKTPGHPENFKTPGVEVSTGPLGQGISNAVGMAIAERHLAATFNKDGFDIVDHHTYVICGDGCLQEGVSSEASSLAGHLGLGKLIVLYDDNLITIDGETELSFTEDVAARYAAYNWHVQIVADGNDLVSLRAAVEGAKQVTDRPSLIKIRTIIGFGSKKEGTEATHGAPLGAADLASVKEKFGFNPAESFVVPDTVRATYQAAGDAGVQREKEWDAVFAAYAAKHPAEAADFGARMKGELPAGWKSALKAYPAEEPKAVATRNRSEEVLNAIAKAVPALMGGSADLTPSNLTALKCSGDFQKETPAGRYIRFGVREHAMAAVCNGMMAHGGVRPFCATFLNFIGYALGSVRLSALSQFGVIYVMTHDSIGLGEDGPTHQPIEMLQSLRAMPNLFTFRPADGNETIAAYVAAMEHTTTPSVICLSRQAAPTLPGSSIDKAMLGGYVVDGAEHAHPGLVIVSTGTEVALAIAAAKRLTGVAVRVVSMPCTEIFDRQPLDYRLSVFPDNVPVLAVEAAGVEGWRKYSHYCVGMTGYGESAPGNVLFAEFGFTAPAVEAKARQVVDFYAQGGGPGASLMRTPGAC